jgi:hypothetical protein
MPLLLCPPAISSPPGPTGDHHPGTPRPRDPQVLLPEAIWPRWADAADVITGWPGDGGPGLGHCQIDAHLGRAEGTVRGWISRFRGQSEDVRWHLTVVLFVADDAPVMPDPSRTRLTDAVSGTTAAHRVAATKWVRVNTVSRCEK